MSLNITTTAFEYGERIPVTHSGDGEDKSLPLRWEEAPKDTVSFALIMEDPDAPNGTFTHWIAYNLPADCQELEKDLQTGKHLDNGGLQGKNDFGKIGYGGPAPPPGEEHRYFIRLFALKKKLRPESANDRELFYQAIGDHVLDEASYMGTYRRKKSQATG